MLLTRYDLGSKELHELAEYISNYITEELNRLGEHNIVSRFLIEDALAAYIGGAADHN